MLAHPDAQASPSYSPSSPHAPLPSARTPRPAPFGPPALIIGQGGYGTAVRGGSGPGGLRRGEARHLLADLPQLPRRGIVAGGGRRFTPLALDVVATGLSRHIRRTGQVDDGVRAALWGEEERPGECRA